jgi:hypothetical protein
MKLDRALQRQILETLRSAYPRRDRAQLFAGAKDDDALEELIIANLVYLEEHKLVHSGVTFSLSGSAIYTGAGSLDFLEDDGGLTTILGTVTVKLHADTIRDLMLAKVEAAPLPPAEKSALKKAISTLSGEALKEIAKKLVAAGMDSAPDAITFLKDLLQ